MQQNMPEIELLSNQVNGTVSVQGPDIIEQPDTLPMLTDDIEVPDVDSGNSLSITRKYVPVIRVQKPKQCNNKKRVVIIILGSMFIFISLVFLVTGTIRFHQCQTQQSVTEWDKRFFKVHFDDLVGLNNFALEKFVNQSSMAYSASDGPAQLAVDGDIKTCSRTDAEISPWISIDLTFQRPIGVVLIHGSIKNPLHDVIVYIVEENGKRNKCEQFPGLVKDKVLATDCGAPLNGRFIVIEMENSVKNIDNLMICEVLVIQR